MNPKPFIHLNINWMFDASTRSHETSSGILDSAAVKPVYNEHLMR